MHARCLESSDLFDDDGPIRLCSLWFSNFTNTLVQNEFEAALARVPSRKFVFLAHQLSARLGKSRTDTVAAGDECLRRLLTRMCREHPFHSLYQVYCLQSDTPQPAGNKRRQFSRHELSSTQTDRSAAAGDLLGQLRTDEQCGERVRNVERACEAFLDWAAYPIKGDKRFSNKKNVPLQVPQDRLLLKLIDTDVPIPTMKTPLDLTLRYENYVCIKNYERAFSTAGGVNLPKINVCVGTDGRRYKQLVRSYQIGLHDAHLTAHSSKARATTTCDKMPSWSKSLTFATAFSVVTKQPASGLCEFAHTWFFPCLHKLACSSSFITRLPWVPGLMQRILGAWRSRRTGVRMSLITPQVSPRGSQRKRRDLEAQGTRK